jgi:hypothetical protein
LNTFNNMTPFLRLLLASLGGIYLLKAVGMVLRRGPGLTSGLARMSHTL